MVCSRHDLTYPVCFLDVESEDEPIMQMPPDRLALMNHPVAVAASGSVIRGMSVYFWKSGQTKDEDMSDTHW